MCVEFIFQKYSESRAIVQPGLQKKQKQIKEIDLHVYVTLKQHVVEVVPEEAGDHHLHHRGPTLISMEAFMGRATKVNALHFIYQ